MPTHKTSGKVIRISPELQEFLRSKWTPETKGWDDFFRTVFGLRSRRKGSRNNIFQVWFLKESGQGFERIADAKGAAIVNAVRAKRKKPEEPVRLREIP